MGGRGTRGKRGVNNRRTLDKQQDEQDAIRRKEILLEQARNGLNAAKEALEAAEAATPPPAKMIKTEIPENQGAAMMNGNKEAGEGSSGAPVGNSRPTVLANAVQKINPLTSPPASTMQKSIPLPTAPVRSVPKSNPLPTPPSSTVQKSNPQPIAPTKTVQKSNPLPTVPAKTVPKSNPLPIAPTKTVQKSNPLSTASSQGKKRKLTKKPKKPTLKFLSDDSYSSSDDTDDDEEEEPAEDDGLAKVFRTKDLIPNHILRRYDIVIKWRSSSDSEEEEDDPSTAEPSIETGEKSAPAAPAPAEKTVDSNVIQLAKNLHLDQRLSKDSEVTLGSAMWKLLSIYRKHSPSEQCMSDFLAFVSVLLPRPNVLPFSSDSILNIVQQLNPILKDPTVDTYCISCFKKWDDCDKECDDIKVNYYVTYDLVEILTDMLENRGLASLVEQSQSLSESTPSLSGKPRTIQDITGGSNYLEINRSAYDLCLIQNCDFFPVEWCSDLIIWPNFLQIAEVPPRLRRHYSFILSAWRAYRRPDMDEYMSFFVDLMKKLSTEGFEWTHPTTGKKINSKVFVVATIVNNQTRASLQKIRPSDCSFCELEGINYPKHTDKTTLFYPLIKKENIRRRSLSTVVNNAFELREALQNRKKIKQRRIKEEPDPDNVKGVQGLTWLSSLKSFDLVNSFSPDYLHSGILGFAKESVDNFYTSRWSIQNKEGLVAERLKKIKLPSFIHQQPRGLEERDKWNSEELRNWIILFSLPCLEGILDDKRTDHLIRLVFALHTLSKSEISLDEIAVARDELQKYCIAFQMCYGILSETKNLHTLLHFADSVLHLGPLWAHSAANFEHENKIMKSGMEGQDDIVGAMLNTCKKLNSDRALKIASHVNDESTKISGQVLGAPEPIEKVHFDVKNFISRIAGFQSFQSTKLYDRVIFDGIVYTNESYSTSTDTCSHYLTFHDSECNMKAAKVLYFCHFTAVDRIYFVGTKVVLLHYRYFDEHSEVIAKHIWDYKETDELICYELSAIYMPLVQVKYSDIKNTCDVLCLPPNKVELSL